MTYKKIIVAMAVLNLFFVGGISSVKADVIINTSSDDDVSQKEEMILNTIEAGDYEAWRRLVNPNSHLARKIEKDDFYKFIRARDLARTGNYQESMEMYNSLKEKTGLTEDKINKVVSTLNLGI